MNKFLYVIAVFMILVSMLGMFMDNGKRNVSVLYYLNGVIGAILLYFV